MGLYIEGGYLPEDDCYTILRIFPDGKVYVQTSGLYECDEKPVLKAIEIKIPHGRLIDENSIVACFSQEADEFMQYGNIDWAFAMSSAISEIRHVSSVIPAEGE